jgi:hypothetical protein
MTTDPRDVDRHALTADEADILLFTPIQEADVQPRGRGERRRGTFEVGRAGPRYDDARDTV